jgi:DNA-binding NarL/FixJ family response regulator
MPGSDGPAHETLSDREFEVFRLLVAGAAVSGIAAKLNLSVKTVSTHKANLMQKLGLANQTELVRYALKHGLTDPLG